MATPVEVPQFGNTVEECIITRWITREGSAVSAGEVIAEIETDKTTFEITAPVTGVVLVTFFEEGAVVPVFTNLCVIGEEGESVESFRPASQGDQGDRRGSSQGDQGDQGDSKDQKETSFSPISPASLSSSSLTSPISLSSGAWSPRATRFATQHDFHPASIAGSGPNGRVLEQDVRQAYASRSHPPSSPRRAGGARATIARRMRESLASTAQYTLHASADARGLLSMRAQTKVISGMADVNINDLVAFCTIQALRDTPAVNAELIDGEIVLHEDVHLGFACDTPRGLLVPVVRAAHSLSLGDLAARMKSLAAQAIDGTISPDDLGGATFTISNLGALGIESFTPVINPPQVAILGVGSIQLKPVRTQGTVEFVDSIGLSLTCDHQVIDGAPGARFLQAVKEKIENVELQCRSQLS